jgi:hypothetical protein
MLMSRLWPGGRVFAGELGTVPPGTSALADRPLRGIGVEATPRVESHENLRPVPGKLLGQPHRVVAGVKDEQGRFVHIRQSSEQGLYLLDGYQVRVLLRADATGVYRRYPGFTGET